MPIMLDHRPSSIYFPTSGEAESMFEVEILQSVSSVVSAQIGTVAAGYNQHFLFFFNMLLDSYKTVQNHSLIARFRN